MWFLEHAWLLPVISAVSFWLIILFGKRLPKGGAEIGITAVVANLVLAFITFQQWVAHVDEGHGGGEALARFVGSIGRSLMPHAEEAKAYVDPVITKYTWWQSGGVKFTFGSHVDGLTVALLVVVTIISTCVHVFSLEYVRGDRRFTHYYAALSLFTGGMLCLVVAQSTLQLLLGWEIMGLCSFMLIGHWWEEQKNSDAALKAFFTTRTGDIGLLVGITITFWGAKSFDIQEINRWALGGGYSRSLIFWGGLALFIAVIGKSGQFPLHTWLPDAMAGPTPVSALIHAATMVVAGVFLVARLYPVFWESAHIKNGGFNYVAVIGGITIVIAAVLAFVQVDIKKVLAYSTVSQLGYMIMGLGVGAWTPAVFHIVTHAFFKALLFLGAGSVSHSGSHHSFDMKRDMGGLRKYMPVTFWTFMIGTAALMGIIPFAGFFSKDEIIANAGYNGYMAFQVVGLVGAFLTAAYMTRCVYLTFFGRYRGGDHPEEHLGSEHVPDDEIVAQSVGAAVNPAMAGAHGGSHGAHAVGPDTHDLHGGHGGGHGGHDDHGPHEPHESNWLLLGPLVVLAFFSITAGFLLALAFNIKLFEEWVEPGGGTFFPSVKHAPFEWMGAIISLAIVGAGILVSALLCKAIYERSFAKGLTKRNKLVGAGYSFLWNKYYLDALYEGVIVRFIKGPLAKASYWINQNIIDAIVNSAGKGTVLVGRWTYKNIDQTIVDGIVNGTGVTAEGAGEALRPVQSGRVQQYGALLFAAAAIGALILVIVV